MCDDSMTLGIMAVARALAQQMQPTEEERRIQAGIDATMREVIADRYNPNALAAPAKVTVAGAVPVVDGPPLSGRSEPRPLAPPPGQEAIERLVNAGCPTDPSMGPKQMSELAKEADR